MGVFAFFLGLGLWFAGLVVFGLSVLGIWLFETARAFTDWTRGARVVLGERDQQPR
jgi:uncharacterized membrane protein YqjE